MRLFDRVVIIGVGLIGGSVALELKNRRLANEVIGISRHKKTLTLAKKMGAIDKGAKDLSIVADADLVILAAPVNTILKLAKKISKTVRPDCIVTDVGSTKEEIVSKLNRLFPCYVGTHPLAGLEKRGIANAQAGIFKDTLCVLTPLKNTDHFSLAKIKVLWNNLGAKTVILSPDAHDQILSFVSHLPHAVAFSLIGVIPDKYLKFAATGLKSTTRIAASEPELWADIFLSNRKNVLKTIELFHKNLVKIKIALNKKDRVSLNKILKEAKVKRDSLL